MAQEIAVATRMILEKSFCFANAETTAGSANLARRLIFTIKAFEAGKHFIVRGISIILK